MENSVSATVAHAGQAAIEDRMLAVLDRLEYRRVTTAEDFEQIGALRLTAFNARDLYEEKFDTPILEEIDFHDQTHVFGLYYDAELVASVRLNLLTSQSIETPALKMCPKVLGSLLAQGLTFVDPSRFAVAPHASTMIPGLPLLTHRLSTMMTMHHNADYVLCVIKKSHEAFYRRMFKATRLAEPFIPEGMVPETLLLGVPRANFDYVTRRNPSFRYTPTEARLLFDRPASALPPLCVRPTARMALKAAA